MAILSQAQAEDSNTPTGWQATATQLHRVASETAGNLRAFVSIAITPPGAAGGLTLHGVRIIAPPGKPPYVSLPQQQRGDRYYPEEEGPPSIAVHRDCGGSLDRHMVCLTCGQPVRADGVCVKAGPGRRSEDLPGIPA